MLAYRTLAFCSLIACLASSNLAFAERAKPDRLPVRFVARSTTIRSTWLGNEDIYLVQLQDDPNGRKVYAKLVDSYPSYAPPLPMRMLVSSSPVTLGLTRDAQCDVLFEKMPIRSAPSDLMAIVPAKLNFHSAETDAIPQDAKIECFRTAGKRVF